MIQKRSWWLGSLGWYISSASNNELLSSFSTNNHLNTLWRTQQTSRADRIGKDMAAKMALTREHIETVSGYALKDEQLLAQALDTTGLRTPQANRRLALLGDMLLRAVIVDEWFPTGAATGKPAMAPRPAGWTAAH